eukprot:2230712-Pyramimonas_sp.AAC.1
MMRKEKEESAEKGKRREAGPPAPRLAACSVDSTASGAGGPAGLSLSLSPFFFFMIDEGDDDDLTSRPSRVSSARAASGPLSGSALSVTNVP